MSLPRNDSGSNLVLVNYGAGDSEGEDEGEEGELLESTEQTEEEAEDGPLHKAEILEHASISPIPNDSQESEAADKQEEEEEEEKEEELDGEEDEESTDILGSLVSGEIIVPAVIPGELGTIEDISEDEDEFSHKRRMSESMNLRDSFMSEPETALTQTIRRLSADEVTLPPEPKGRCSKKLQDKISRYYRKNLDMNASIQNRKDFRNPSIYEKLISYLGIDELGTNYPKDVFNPHGLDEGSYYESLAKAQKEEMAKREKEKKDRTKVEFVSGVAKKPKTEHAAPPDEERKRKTKWDAPALNPIMPLLGRPQVAIITTTITVPTVVSTTISSTGTKTTVISAIGTIKKPKLEKVEKVEKVKN